MDIVLDVLVTMIGGFLWDLLFFLRRRVMKRMRAKIARSGETWIIEPRKAYYQRVIGGGLVGTGTIGAMGLTQSRLIFIPLFGRNKEYPLKDIVSVSENKSFAGNYRNGRPFLILKLTDGDEVGFQAGDIQRWMEEVRSRAGV